MGTEIKKYKNALAIFLSGELDQYEASIIKSKMDVEIQESEKKNVIIDLADVSMMDSSGIGLIIGRYKLVCSLGKELVLSGGSESIRKVITLSGIEKIVPYYKTADEASKSFREGSAKI